MPSPDTQFWWNWWVQLATALATFLAVVTALFLDWFRAKFFPPVLELRFVDVRGAPPVKTFVHVELPDQPPQEYETVGHWYHVQVTNKRRMSRATDTQVYLLAVETQNAAGQYVRRPTGAIPFGVRHEVFVRPGRIIGPPVEWDFCNVAKEVPLRGGPNFILRTVVAPTDITTQMAEPFKMAFTLQARSIEKDSNLLRVEVSWNGQWADDTDQMANYLVINEQIIPTTDYYRAIADPQNRTLLRGIGL
jgi:hypothetical protein